MYCTCIITYILYACTVWMTQKLFFLLFLSFVCLINLLFQFNMQILEHFHSSKYEYNFVCNFPGDQTWNSGTFSIIVALHLIYWILEMNELQFKC